MLSDTLTKEGKDFMLGQMAELSIIDGLIGRSDPELEQAEGGAWVKHYFPNRFDRPMKFYQADFWDWVNTVPSIGS
jgi:hypothetical protein